MWLFDTLKLSRQYQLFFVYEKKKNTKKNFERMKNMYWFKSCIE